MAQKSIIRKKTLVVATMVFALFIFLGLPIRDYLASKTNESLNNKPALLVYNSLAGNNRPTRTLLVFANSAEQRIGGGFVGSVGVLNGNKNRLGIESVRSIYYYDHRLEERAAFVDAPEYMKNITANILARDSLIFSEPQTSAALFRDLYARDTGEYIDNVVIITPKVLSLVLLYTGPIDLDEYNLKIDSNNITTVLQTEVESGKDKKEGKDPKTVLRVLSEKLLERVPKLSYEQLTNIIKDVDGLMQTKQMYVSINDSQIMAKLRPYQDSMAKPGVDNSVLISVANHGANKSSQAINQSTEIVLRIDESGKANMHIKVQRDHTSDYSGYYVDPKTNEEKYLIADDLSWLQAELPSGTTLQSSTGSFKQIAQKPAIFGVDTLTKPLAQTIVEETFLLPTKYAMLEEVVIEQNVLAQFGWFGQRLDFRVELPETYGFDSGSDGVTGSGSSASKNIFQIGDENMKFVFRKE